MSAVDILRDALFGNPPSVTMKPSREGVLAAFARLNEGLNGALAGIVYYATGAARSADTSKPIGTIGKAADEPDFYRREGSGWVIDNSLYHGVLQLVDPLVDRAETARDIALAAVAPFVTDIKVAAERQTDGTAYAARDNHYRWAVGVQAGPGQDIPAGVAIGVVGFDVELSASIAALRLRVFQRPTSPSTYDLAPGVGPADTLVHDEKRPLTALNLTPTGLPLQSLVFPFPALTTEAGATYLFEVTAYNASSVTQGFGISRNSAAGTALVAQQRGFYDGGFSINAPEAIAWRVGTLTYMLDSASVAQSAEMDTRVVVSSADLVANGYALAATGTITSNGIGAAFSSSITVSAPQNGNVTGEAVTLTNSYGLTYPAAFYNPMGKLAHANVSAVVVKDASSGAVLTLGTDYILNAYSGIVALPGSGSNRAVRVDYHWSQARYDTVCIDSETSALSVASGAERTTDSGEYLPALSSSKQIPLFNVRIADGFAAEPVPVWYLDGLVHRDVLASRAADFERQRRNLMPILRMAARGETIRVAMLGDSIVAQESSSGPIGTPNTAVRDRPEYFAANIGADRVAQMPRFDNGDGAGQVHVRASTGWGLVRALQDLGATVEFYNFAIGGTASGTGAGNAKDPAMRNAVWALNPHLLVTHYGMNETGSDETEANLVDLFNDAYAHGVLSILALGMPRPSPFKPVGIGAVRKTWRATRRAAAFCKAAYFDPARLVDDAYLGAMGLSLRDYGSADRFHHPGIRECAVYAAELHALVAGR